MTNQISTLQLANSAWPKFRHDIENTGQSQYPSYADGTLKWATNPLKMIKLLNAVPAISSSDVIYIADPDGVLRAFYSNLVQKWAFDTGAEVTSKPVIDPSRLEGLDNPIFPAPENVLITRVYTLDDLDISSALLGTIDFSVYITDSCPTGSKICTETCTITIGCIAPVCNFQVT